MHQAHCEHQHGVRERLRIERWIERALLLCAKDGIAQIGGVPLERALQEAANLGMLGRGGMDLDGELAQALEAPRRVQLFCEGSDSVRTLLDGRRTIKAAGIPLQLSH